MHWHIWIFYLNFWHDVVHNTLSSTTIDFPYSVVNSGSLHHILMYGHIYQSQLISNDWSIIVEQITRQKQCFALCYYFQSLINNKIMPYSCKPECADCVVSWIMRRHSCNKETSLKTYMTDTYYKNWLIIKSIAIEWLFGKLCRMTF